MSLVSAGCRRLIKLLLRGLQHTYRAAHISIFTSDKAVYIPWPSKHQSQGAHFPYLAVTGQNMDIMWKWAPWHKYYWGLCWQAAPFLVSIWTEERTTQSSDQSIFNHYFSLFQGFWDYFVHRNLPGPIQKGPFSCFYMSFLNIGMIKTSLFINSIFPF